MTCYTLKRPVLPSIGAHRLENLQRAFSTKPEPETPASKMSKRELRHQDKQEMLSQAQGRLGRLAARFKWLMIRAQRPFNTDDLSAMFSWIIWGHILWIVLGTTTFLSLLIWFMSKFNLEEHLATFVGNIVTKETGMRVIFEEAMVPDWKKGSIVFRKVFVSRRPGPPTKKVRVGSQSVAAAAAKVEHRTETEADDDGNYTQFDLTIDSVAVTLSVGHWFSGQGILQTVDLKGMRGVVDRRHLKWDPDWDPTKNVNVPKRGDFVVNSFKMEDVLVTVMQPNGGGQFDVGVYSCDLPRLRKQWLLYDFLNANNMSGSYDNSLFTLHPRQLANQFDATENNSYQRIQRLRIDNVDVRHLNRGVEGMFGWIESGTVDFLADLMLPSADAPVMSLKEKVLDLLERWQAVFRRQKPSEIVTQIDEKLEAEQSQKRVLIDLRVQFNNTRAQVPLYSADLNPFNNALMHPIIGYINSRDTYIPIHCRVVKKLSDFDGSWTVYDSRLMDDTSDSLYEAFALNVSDHEARNRRIRKVGFWSMQFLAQLVLLTLGIVA
ncbi:Mitochondrial distribution and morphology protein 31 [Wickerhamiella sorbophila]|uniref:Mitochondrial distribution and morphology protein 31 n=1 Tax=Wickerhamiella sorbophila TaxID=45607 RepID=A0A2T0FKS9_9ASCO|nr:Mitochondrial distribution and morphology protein 31 [Wickerhamiella sorbophila]PRT55596.1 Mitochondrial distribution and morphology protein 31 [Wickerhamiella sorbophila]